MHVISFPFDSADRPFITMAPNDKEHPILQFLRSPLLPFPLQFQDEADNKLNVQSVRTGTTSTWSRKFLGSTSLSVESLIDLEADYVTDFVKAASKFPPSVDPPATPSMHVCLYPRTEEDTSRVIPFICDTHFLTNTYDNSTAVCAQILDAIIAMARQNKLAWFPNTKYAHLCISALNFHGELLGEAYARSRSSNLPGVRVDKLFVLTPLVNEDHPDTRLHKNNLLALELPDMPKKNTPNDVKCQVEYLKRGQVWKLGSISNFSWNSQRKKCKALLPIEIKVR